MILAYVRWRGLPTWHLLHGNDQAAEGLTVCGLAIDLRRVVHAAGELPPHGPASLCQRCKKGRRGSQLVLPGLAR